MTDWQLHALCRGDENPDAWFADGTKDDRAELARAQAICRRCPVIEQCAELGRKASNGFGVWGGVHPKSRGGYRPTHIEHGTVRGYRTHRRRSEEACAECRAAYVAELGFACGGPECDHPHSERKHRLWGIEPCERSRSAAREYRRKYNARKCAESKGMTA